MSDLQTLKDVVQIVNYIALSVTGPLALFSYMRTKRREQAEREYRIFDELDNKLLEFQKLALQHDLELLGVADYDPIIAGDRFRKKQELVASEVGFSLFQRAYLMFHSQSDAFRARQWRGWEDYLRRFLARPTVKDAWQVCKGHYDTRFQAFVHALIAEDLERVGTDPAVVYAFRTTGLWVRDEIEHTLPVETLMAWRAALAEYATQGDRQVERRKAA